MLPLDGGDAEVYAGQFGLSHGEDFSGLPSRETGCIVIVDQGRGEADPASEQEAQDVM